jgi:hypothetical protein
MKIENIIRRVLREQQEEEKLLKIPGIRFFNNDWDLLQKFLESQGNPRYSIGGDLNLREKEVGTLGNLVRVEGYLSLFGTYFDSLGSLEYVGGDLDLRDTDVETLENLVRVEGSLDLGSTRIKTLGNLEYVGGSLSLEECLNLKSLGKLKYVGRWLDLRKTELKSFGDLEYVGGSLDLERSLLSKKYTEEQIRRMVNVIGRIYIISDED